MCQQSHNSIRSHNVACEDKFNKLSWTTMFIPYSTIETKFPTQQSIPYEER